MPNEPQNPNPQPTSPVANDPEFQKWAQSVNQKQTFDAANLGQKIVREAYNPFSESQTYSYNPDSSDQNKNFRRYYWHSSYDKLGFNPWMNNEAIYNEKGSKWGDISRSIKAAVPLISTGFVSPLRSYADIASGDFSKVDHDSGDSMGYWNRIGGSSRGGALGFTANLITNSAYTVGIIGETIGEMYLTRGISAPNAMKNMALITKNFAEYGKAVEGIGKTVGVLSKDYGAAKVAWEGVKKGAQYLNPLENTLPALYEGIKNFKSVDKLALASETAGAFYRDLRMANLTLSEAKMEGAMAEQDLEDNLVSEYKNKHNGEAPPLDRLMMMKQAAKEAGLHTLGWNVPVIYLTNKFTFEPLLNSFSKEGEFALKNGTKFVEKEGEGFVKSTFKNRVVNSLKPKSFLKAPLDYFGRNFSEGFQETAQEIVSGTFTDHYKDLYEKSDPKKGLDTSLGENVSWGTLNKNVLDQFSGKGFEVFASGFLMGGLLGAVKAPFAAGYNLAKDYKQQKNEYAEKTLQTLNEMYKDPLKFFGHNIINFAQGSDAVGNQVKAEANGQQKEWMDFEHSNLTSQVTTALQTNTYDVLLDKLRGIKSMEPQAIKDAYGVDGQEVLSKIDKVIGRAENIKENWEKWNKRYQNPFNPFQYNKDSEDYKKQALGYVSWQNARNMAVFNDSSLSRNQARVQSITNDLLNIGGMRTVAPNDVSLLLHSTAINNELRTLDQELEVMESSDIAETRKAASVKRAKQKRLETFYKALQGYYLGQNIKNVKGKDAQKIVDEVGTATKGQLFNAYQAYVNHLTEASGRTQPVNHLDLENSFQKLLDIHELNQDNIFHAEAVDLLANPKNFLDQYDRMNNAMSEVYDKREDLAKQAIAFTQSKIEDNAILGTLFQRGFVVDPKQAEELIKNKKVPDEFFDINAKQVVKKGDPRHAQFADIVKNYIEVTKPEEKPEPVPVQTAPSAVAQPVQTGAKQTAPSAPKKIDIDLDAIFASVTNGEELDSVEGDMMNLFSTHSSDELAVSGLDVDDIENRIEAKKQELSKDVTIDNINVGDVLTMADPKGEEHVQVIEKGKDWIRAERLGDAKTKVVIKENNLKSIIKNRYQMAANVKATPDEVNNVKQSVTTSEKVTTNAELVTELVNEALKDKAAAQQEFLELLGCE